MKFAYTDNAGLSVDKEFEDIRLALDEILADVVRGESSSYNATFSIEGHVAFKCVTRLNDGYEYLCYKGAPRGPFSKKRILTGHQPFSETIRAAIMETAIRTYFNIKTSM